MMEFLRSQSILSLSEWCDLEEAERWDVLSLMKRAGLVVGDRKKMLKSTLQVITDWRAEVAARGFLVRRNSLVWVATDGKDREKTLKPKQIRGLVGSLSTGNSGGVATQLNRPANGPPQEAQPPASLDEYVILPAGTQYLSTQEKQTLDVLLDGETPRTPCDNGATVPTGEKFHLEEGEVENDYAPLLGTGGSILASHAEFDPSNNIVRVRVEESDYDYNTIPQRHVTENEDV